MTDDTLKLAKPLDPIYANPEPGKPNNTTAHNRWRANMSEYCWLCRNFDSCTPGHKCRHQVDIDVQAQWPTKGGYAAFHRPVALLIHLPIQRFILRKWTSGHKFYMKIIFK